MSRNMKNDWWFKFEYSKWDDPSLQLCRMETQGFWLRVYIALRKSGKASVTASVEKLSGLAGCTPPEVIRSVTELKQFDVANVTLCNGQSVTRNSLVTLESRSLKRELSSKEKTRLRVQRHRSNADVTGDVTPQSKSKEKEVIEEKKEERGNPPPEPNVGDFAPPENRPPKDSLFYHPVIEALRTVTKRNPPAASRPILIEKVGGAIDLAKLQVTFGEWSASGYKDTNFAGILDWYLGKRNGKVDDAQKIKAQLGKDNGEESTYNCPLCFDTGEVSVGVEDSPNKLEWVACKCKVEVAA